MATRNPTGIDAYKPSEIAELVEQAGIQKARLAPLPLLTLAVLGGAFIAFGAAAYTMTMTGLDPSIGSHRLLGGLVFSLGLILIIVGGAELFTGNALMVMAATDQRIGLLELLRSWSLVYVGNFLGAIAIALAMYFSGLLDSAMGGVARNIAAAKLDLTWLEALFRGILCNALVCLAIWLSLAARTVASKILAIIGPISCFVVLGLEHSIANMYFLPQGFLAGAEFRGFDAFSNLFFVTAGNIIGGAGGVALTYRFAYGPPARPKERAAVD